MSFRLATLPAAVVSIGGTRIPLTTGNFKASSVLVQADDSNVGAIYVGDITVDDTNGIVLPPGASATIEGDSVRGISDELCLEEIHIYSSTSGNKARISYFRRKP